VAVVAESFARDRSSFPGWWTTDPDTELVYYDNFEMLEGAGVSAVALSSTRDARYWRA
jgi:hypothetical protein